MKTSTKVIITLVLLLLIGGLAAGDAIYREKSLTGQLSLWLQGDSGSGTIASSGTGVVVTPTEPEAGNSSGAVITDDTAKNQVLAVLVSQGYTFEENAEPSFLKQILPGSTVYTETLLFGGDRAGSLSWVKLGSDTTKTYETLKESLLQSFSSNLQDLSDQTYTNPGKPVYSILRFFDPALSTERMAFVKSDNAIYEVHMVDGKQDQLAPLLDALPSAI